MTPYTPRTVLITGATSDFGVAFAKRFAAIGCQLILHGRDVEKLDGLKQALPMGKTHAMVADLNSPAEIEEAVAGIPTGFAAVDLLINNAGGALGLEKFHEKDVADIYAMIAANCGSLAHISRLVVAGMAQRKVGHVINITSSAANWAYPGGNIYSACKAFAKHLSLNMRADLAGTNIRVTSIEPGMVETTFSLKRFKGDKAKAAAVYAGTEPLTADDIAETVFWSATLPPHVNINTMEIMPTKQSFAGFTVERD